MATLEIDPVPPRSSAMLRREAAVFASNVSPRIRTSDVFQVEDEVENLHWQNSPGNFWLLVPSSARLGHEGNRRKHHICTSVVWSSGEMPLWALLYQSHLLSKVKLWKVNR